jgi:hypothetical protein
MQKRKIKGYEPGITVIQLQALAHVSVRILLVEQDHTAVPEIGHSTLKNWIPVLQHEMKFQVRTYSVISGSISPLFGIELLERDAELLGPVTQ